MNLAATLVASVAVNLEHAAINWPLTLTVTALAVVGSLIGVRLSTLIPARLLRTGFGWFLIGMATLVLIEQAPGGVRHILAGTAAGRIVVVAACTGLALAAVRHVHGCRILTTSGRG